MEFNGLTSASHMSLPEAGYGSEEGQLGSEISGAVSGVTTPGASRLQASQLQERPATMQRLQSCGAVLPCGVLLVGCAVRLSALLVFVFSFVLFSFATNPCCFSVPLKTF